MSTELNLRFALASMLVALSACDNSEEPKTYDPDATIAEAITFATAYDRLDVAPIPSIHGTMDGFGEIYANEAAAEVFRTIDGNDPSDTATFPAGSILVKHNLDANMQPLGVLTILAKFEPGYYPEGGDWFYAMVTTDGEPIDGVIGNAVETVFCYDCHAQMGPNTDNVIGLAPDLLR